MEQMFGEGVRIRYETAGNFPVSADVFIEELQSSGEWVVVRSFNSMSDDYAYTNAAEYAKKLRAIRDNNDSNQRT